VNFVVTLGVTRFTTAPPDSGSAVDTSATDPAPTPTAALPTILSPERMLERTRSIAACV